MTQSDKMQLFSILQPLLNLHINLLQRRPLFKVARILLEINDDAIGNRPLAAGSKNLAFRQQDGIVPEEKLEVVGDDLLDLFFGLELDFGIECAGGSEKHGDGSYSESIASALLSFFQYITDSSSIPIFSATSANSNI